MEKSVQIHPAKKKRYDAILNNLKKGSVLNLGGDSLMIKYLKRNFKSPILNANLDSGEIRGDLNQGIPWKDNSFENVVAGELIEHLFNPDKFMGECYRVLNKKGVFIISTPNMTGLPYIMNEDIGMQKGKYMPHINAFNSEMIKFLLRRNNFKILKIEYIESFWSKNFFMKVLSKIFRRLRSNIIAVAIKD